MRVSVGLICLGLFVFPALAADKIAERVTKLELSEEQLLGIGETLFNTEGANTCLKCHGAGGHGGDQAGAADLRHPRTWRAYQALGGDEAFNADKNAFLANMATIIHVLIREGAPTWNLRFAKSHKDIEMDWSKVTIPDKVDKYNSMMKGITSGPMKKALKTMAKQVQADIGIKLKSKDRKDVAAVATYLYVRSFDDGSDQAGVFK
jgi:hypothetical protein